jgi:hypothetical protein
MCFLMSRSDDLMLKASISILLFNLKTADLNILSFVRIDQSSFSELVVGEQVFWLSFWDLPLLSDDRLRDTQLTASMCTGA